MKLEIKYDYWASVGSCFIQFILTTAGELVLKTDHWWIKAPWYKREPKWKKNWIPKKRRNFVSLIKWSIREGDFDELVKKASQDYARSKVEETCGPTT